MSFISDINMKQLFNVFKIASQTSRVNVSLLNYVPQRGVRYETKITWNDPPKYRNYDPIRSGDGRQLKIVNPSEIHFDFKDSKELETADEKVRKIFSLRYMKPRQLYLHYRNEILDKVKDHPFEQSTSTKIASYTAKIRHFQKILNERPSRQSSLKVRIDSLIGKRRSLLKKLRTEDYKKFEWLLETLDLQFNLANLANFKKVTRKSALMLLAQLKAEKIKEEKLAELKRQFDNEKIPFIESKIAKMKQIKEMEERVGLQPTVTDEDIQKCVEQLEKVKLDVKERERIGYKRKIHPYYMEPYHELLLKEKEKKGQKNVEELKKKQQNESVTDNAS